MKISSHQAHYTAGGSWDYQERMDSSMGCRKYKGHNNRSHSRDAKDKTLGRRFRRMVKQGLFD